MQFDGLPGGDLVASGLADLERGARTRNALLVAIGAPRLRALGVAVPNPAIARPELALYELLTETEGTAAHSRYNALVRRLVSFEHALACASR
ncbi:MAG TPA: hypothetical protein VFT98_16370 [Myxococcota bacterium]|nr:hypothetical protein [Myxococcota bacterium]